MNEKKDIMTSIATTLHTWSKTTTNSITEDKLRSLTIMMIFGFSLFWKMMKIKKNLPVGKCRRCRRLVSAVVRKILPKNNY
jgi:hypothetical protein